ncbi:MAG: hypothetical protein FJX62_18450 [Alphaproteobacteria bacterium]|nr:hypothetical protein [Alphaproteobacteria bacterium]
MSKCESRCFLGSLRIVIGALALAAALNTPAGAASVPEKGIYLSGKNFHGIVPPCDWPSALARIQSRFASKEARFWDSDLRIVDFERVRQTAYRPWARDTVPRRFCSGRVLTSDGRRRTIHYSIIEDGGHIGVSWGVEWCVVGVDRNWAYNPGCKMARP